MGKKWVGMRILIVEDDVSLLDILCEFIEGTGATVFRANNGQLALECLASEKIDFVLSDVQMPVMDGVEMLKRIRHNNPNLPIVLLSTGQSQLTEETALASGASGLIHKPFRLNEISSKIDLLLATVKKAS